MIGRHTPAPGILSEDFETRHKSKAEELQNAEEDVLNGRPEEVLNI